MINFNQKLLFLHEASAYCVSIALGLIQKLDSSYEKPLDLYDLKVNI